MPLSPEKKNSSRSSGLLVENTTSAGGAPIVTFGSATFGSNGDIAAPRTNIQFATMSSNSLPVAAVTENPLIGAPAIATQVDMVTGSPGVRIWPLHLLVKARPDPEIPVTATVSS